MAHELYEAVYEISPHKGNLLWIESHLASWADTDGWFTISYTHLAHRLRMDRGNVKAYINKLIKANAIRKAAKSEIRGINRFQFTEKYLEIAAEIRMAWAGKRAVRDRVEDGVQDGVRDGVKGGVKGGVQDGVRDGVRDGVKNAPSKEEQENKRTREQGNSLPPQPPLTRGAVEDDPFSFSTAATTGCESLPLSEAERFEPSPFDTLRARLVTAITGASELSCVRETDQREFFNAVATIAPEFDASPPLQVEAVALAFKTWWRDVEGFDRPCGVNGFIRHFPRFRAYAQQAATVNADPRGVIVYR